LRYAPEHEVAGITHLELDVIFKTFDGALKYAQTHTESWPVKTTGRVIPVTLTITPNDQA